MTTGSDNSD